MLIVLLAVSISHWSAVALAAEITLQWDASDGATGYALHYGIQSNSYDSVVDVGPNLQHTLSDLEVGRSYFFAVTAYNELAESDYSAEVVYEAQSNLPPTANAGPDQTAEAMTAVILNGADSFDPDDGIKVLFWEQIEGPQVELSGSQEEICRFTAPAVDTQEEILVFRLVVQDYAGHIAADTCTVAVTASSDVPQTDDSGESAPPTDTVEIFKATYRESKDRLVLQAASDGDSAATVLTAWVVTGYQEIKLGNLRYRARTGDYRGVFRNIAPAPDRVFITSSSGGTASASCDVRR